MDFAYTISPENVSEVVGWMAERGGCAVWGILDLSSPGTRWLTPLKDEDGQSYGRPNWRCSAEPTQVVTDPAQIGVINYVEVERFHVALRRGGNGLAVKLTDASSERLRKKVAKAGEGATYVFDYGTQEAVILKPDEVRSLADWMVQNVEVISDR